MLYKLCRAREDDEIIWIEDEVCKVICLFWSLNWSGHQVAIEDAESNARKICQLLNKGEDK